MPTRALRFYFDFSCPYAYVASTRIEALGQRVGVAVDPRPILLGGVFRARATPQDLSQTLSPAKARHNLADIHRQAARAGVPLTMPKGHPIRTVEALRALLVVGPPFMPLAHALFRAYWVDGIDLSSRAGLHRVLSEAGHDADAVLAKINDPAIKQDLRERTEEAITAGVFGVPTCVIPSPASTDASPQPDLLFWGVDRLEMVERHLTGASAASPRSPALDRPHAPVDVYFDYASPFAYLGCHRAEQALGDHARWHPMLLGALFKQVGTANVPLFTQNDAKRQHTTLDLQRQAAAAEVPYRFPTRFPMRTVLALRVTLAAKAHETAAGRRLIHALFRAYWADDRDISDPAELARICDSLGFDGAALIEAAGEASVKQALFAETEAAVEAGVFGAPTFVVKTRSGPELFWGADRLDLAVDAAVEARG
ncbi:2-hydroxychromene-2-carboxylate isomerase [Enhygromyxa salina]|uniref:2-hydroxychromene-2-carboxylate isomerase n=1 Tax=Enhygromyxa salina TaxID=215803 RepID=A0A0C2D0F7_9BACT|nr:2-hydroxychromene-2-carboxylate isomerase [Enhygromyxa salina]KIG13632.1 2-hydroxychromene-2-carboxylate isomerase [Enhygromyxa salina]